MKPRTLRHSELRAGQTFFIGYLCHLDPTPRVVVAEYLVTGRRGHWPAEGCWYPYRLRPELIAHIADDCVLWRTRRDARRHAEQAVQKLNHKQEAKAL